MRRNVRLMFLVLAAVLVVAVGRLMRRDDTLHPGEDVPVAIELKGDHPDTLVVRLEYQEPATAAPRRLLAPLTLVAHGGRVSAAVPFAPGGTYVIRPRREGHAFTPDSFRLTFGQVLHRPEAHASFACSASIQPTFASFAADPRPSQTTRDKETSERTDPGAVEPRPPAPAPALAQQTQDARRELPEPELTPAPVAAPAPSSPRPGPSDVDTRIPEPVPSSPRRPDPMRSTPPPPPVKPPPTPDSVPHARTLERTQAPSAEPPPRTPEPLPSRVPEAPPPRTLEPPPPPPPEPPAASASPARQPAAQVSPLLAQAEQLFGRGDYAGVLALPAEPPSSASPNYLVDRAAYLRLLEYRGCALLARDEPEEAAETFRTILQTARQEGGIAQYNLLLCLHRMGKHREVVREAYPELQRLRSTIPKDRLRETTLRASFLAATSFCELCREAGSVEAAPDCREARQALEDFLAHWERDAAAPLVRPYVEAARWHLAQLQAGATGR